MSVEHTTALTQIRYDRLAPLYDRMATMAERRFQPWREELWSQVEGQRILEVGVGTGKNMPYYPRGAQLTAIDLSGRMLAQAWKRAERDHIYVRLEQMDAQALAFERAEFDTAVATFVFCSVPDPVQGLRELARVVRPGGRILLLDHVRLDRPVVGRLMDLLNPLVVRLMGANINRRTVENVRQAGLIIEKVADMLPSGLVKLIVAQVSQEES